MTMNVISFFRPRPNRDWNNDELAQLYRVDSALLKLGIGIETARGVTDEGDPWFVFCRADGGDVLVHVARFDGDYHLVAPTVSVALRGSSIAQLTQTFVESIPVTAPLRRAPNVFLHPSALLTMLVAALFFSSEHSQAAALDKAMSADADGDTGADVGSAGAGGWFTKPTVLTSESTARAEAQSHHLSMYLNAVGAAIALVLGVGGDHVLDLAFAPLQLDDAPVIEASVLTPGLVPAGAVSLAMEHGNHPVEQQAAIGVDAPAPQPQTLIVTQAELPVHAPTTPGSANAPAPALDFAVRLSGDDAGQEHAFASGNDLIRWFTPGSQGSGTPEASKKLMAEHHAQDGEGKVGATSALAGEKIVVTSSQVQDKLSAGGASGIDQMLVGKIDPDGLLVFGKVDKGGIDLAVGHAAGHAAPELSAPPAPKLFDMEASRQLKSFMEEHPQWKASLSGNDFFVSDGLNSPDAGPAVTLYSWEYSWGGTMTVIGHLPLMDLVA